MSSKGVCQHCGCNEIEKDPSRGDAVCTNCGSVLEQNIIVSEVQFEENARGGASALGQFVSVDGKAPGSRLPGNFSNHLGRESRLITLENGRRKITEIAGQLRLNQHCIDTAFNFYKMMVSRHLTRGRKLSHVIAACVYIVCRTEGTPHMLLDLSDIVQVNVYELGKTYLKLSTALCINIPAIDPCLYIMRFAHRLEFGEKTHEVSMTALRLVQRMKRDWIHTGRRPSGLCGAALLVAARLHDFNRTLQDLIKVVKVGVTTLRNRLSEFGETPTSRLTLEEFMNIDLEEEQDPPCYKAARRKHKLQVLEEQNKVEEVTDKISYVQKMIEKALRKNKKHKGRFAKEAILADSEDGENDVEDENVQEFLVEDTLKTIQSVVEVGNEETVVDIQQSSSAITSLPIIATVSNSSFGPGPTAASLGLKETIEECMIIKKSDDEGEESGELDLNGIDDDELDAYIMSEPEVNRKTAIWMKLNADYLEEQKVKEEKRAKEREEEANKPDAKKKRKYKKKVHTQANTAGEAIEKMLQERKISNKINYDVLKNLNTDATLLNLSKIKNESETGSSNADSAKSSRFKRRVSFSEHVAMASPSKLIKKEKMDDSIKEEAEDVKPDVKNLNPDQRNSVPASDVIVEDGPIDINKLTEDLEMEEDDDDGEEEEGHLSAAQLLRQHAGDEYDGYYSQEEYY